MYAHTVVAKPGQTLHIRLPGARELTLHADGKIDPHLLDGFHRSDDLVTDLEDERLKRFVETGSVSDLGQGWKEGFGGLCYLPDPQQQGRDVNLYAAALQTVQVNYRQDPTVVTVVTNLYDGPVYNHELRGQLDPETGHYREVEERAHFTIADRETLSVDGQHHGWESAVQSVVEEERSHRQLAVSLLNPGRGELHEEGGMLFFPGGHLRKRM